MARLSEHGIRLSSMSPSFLNSNSTSHTWPFSAVAELIDNASDPGVSAKQIWIDVVDEVGHLCLTFTDNGSGMTPNKLHKMLSFGFTEKGSGKGSQQAIGVYGNGFKSGSMRLGRDALIFTKNGGCQTVGMLSQTYLENIKAQAVIVPIVPFNQQTKSLVVTEDSEASLAAILQHSIITSHEQIHAHFDSIRSKKGTKILIWNIRRAKDGKPEIDFETDLSDFRLPDIQIEELKKGLRNSGSLRAEQNIPDMHYSLRAYLSILYLKPRTQIILRGKKNLAKLVSKRLTHIEHDVYKPHFSKEKVKVTFGLNLKNKDHYGIMMYHKNRLIKAYEKVGCQLKTSGQRAGIGVIGIIECNFLKPAHNKQDFEYTKEYRLTLGALGLKLNDYWKEVTEKKAREREFQALDRDENEDRDDDVEAPMWLQCEECLKWRCLPGSHYNSIPESWNCSQNPNPHYRSCSLPEEAEDSEELLTPSYQKTHKRDHPKGRKREKSLEVCRFQDQEHHIFSRSSSEPSQPTFQSTHTPGRIRTADRCHTEENTLEQDETNTDHLADYYTDTHDDAQTHGMVTAEVTHKQQKPIGRDTVIRDKTQVTEEQVLVENETNDHRDKDTNMELMEREEENTDTLSHKRKSGSLFYCVKKKPCLWEEQQPDSENMAEEMNPEKQRKKPETLSLEKTKQDSSSQVEKPGDTAQRNPTSLTWTHSLPSTQTVMVSPLSRTEGPRSRPLPPEGSDEEANVQKLAGLEKEAQKLRRLLGLEITKTTRGTMTTADSSAEKPKGRLVTPPVSTASREVGCQTDVAESSSSSSSRAQAPGPQGVVVQGQKAVCGPKEQPEQNRPRKERTETQSRMRVSDSEACEDSSCSPIRSAQENLHGIRNNVVVLLTALLPQLDLAGISLETTDVDNILQQIVEVNSLKL
ncbi:MORC family CW-type zinc finger protein 3 isoform X2 [Siniperca chuatsi]|uniref:MORC family CW-type zinc finger protein 3 isoform X2 n=1 Tax=Siniperca chuatsi TaxID=119488 RepID=UPI001CE15515|nr:MORC family CW-type zinc finger protein 3 isoform X2 [Siniperca chuatsi]